MGAEKWLDIELWDSAKDCFQVLKSRGYRIATTHVGIDAVMNLYLFLVLIVFVMENGNWHCCLIVIVASSLNCGVSLAI